jgi:hypothetical protein
MSDVQQKYLDATAELRQNLFNALATDAPLSEVQKRIVALALCAAYQDGALDTLKEMVSAKAVKS